MRLPAAAAAAVVLALAPASAYAAKVVPRKAVPGATVELRGGDLPEKGTVKVDGRRAEVVSRKQSKVRFVVPKVHSGTRPVRLGDVEARMRVLKRFRGNVGIELAENKRAKKKIGPGGGSIKAKAAGLTYQLNVPAGALGVSKRITMTPVVALKNLPLSRNRPAAVQLRPNGLEFETPAELSIAGLKKPARQVGFTMTDRGRGLELVQAKRVGKRVLISLDHFTTPGAGGPTEQNFVSIFQQFLSSTSATLTRGQVETLLVELDIAQSYFPEFCETQAICEDIQQRARESLERLIDVECDRQTAQPSVGGVSILLDLAAQLRVLAGAGVVPDCVDDILQTLAEHAIANVRTNPFGNSNADFQLTTSAFLGADLNQDQRVSWIEWVYYLAGEASLIASDIGAELTGEFSNALEETLADGRALCETNRDAGRALLDKGYAIAKASDFMKVEYEVALTECACEGDGGSAALATAAQTCPAGQLTLLERTGFVFARAMAASTADGPHRKDVTDPLAPFTETASASISSLGDSSSSSAAQSSSIAVGTNSLTFTFDGTVEAAATQNDQFRVTESMADNRGHVLFEITESAPYTLTGSVDHSSPSDGAVSGTAVSLLQEGGQYVVNFSWSDVTVNGTWENKSGVLSPGTYDLSITSQAHADNNAVGQASTDGQVDLTLTVG
ncbi:MAG TPA: hypothetical protein VD790_08090 [Thermoleophilaceae bacterium]|nr:hypothetical protein [Thermoleophilaceae bacterium]